MREYEKELESELKKVREEKPFLSVEESRKVLGISRVSIYKLIHTKGFPVIRISPKRYIIPANKLLEWAEKQLEM